MKQTVILSIGIILIIGLSSCDMSKRDCTEASAGMIQTILFLNFQQSDVDSMVLTSYTPSSNFTSPLDSFLIHGIEYDSLNYFAHAGLINIARDYKVRMPKSGMVFKLSQFATKRVICNPGLFNKSYFDQLASYYLNGKKVNSSSIDIYKE